MMIERARIEFARRSNIRVTVESGIPFVHITDGIEEFSLDGYQADEFIEQVREMYQYLESITMEDAQLFCGAEYFL